MVGQPGGADGSPPPLTPALRAGARRSPKTWLYVIDPAFDPDGEVPPHGVVGAWWVNGRGQISGEFRRNPGYRPSPRALELERPADPLDDLLQRAATGHASDAELVGALLDAELFVFAREDRPGRLYSVEGHEGRRLLQAFTSEARLPAEWARWEKVTGRGLAPALAGPDLELNPGGPVSVRIPGEARIAAAGS